MNQSDKDFVELNRTHYITLTKAGFVQNLSNEIKSEMLRIIRENFNPGYLCCMHCPGDIAAMIQFLYLQYDKLPIETTIEEPQEPIQEPIQEQTKKKKNVKSTKS